MVAEFEKICATFSRTHSLTVASLEVSNVDLRRTDHEDEVHMKDEQKNIIGYEYDSTLRA